MSLVDHTQSVVVPYNIDNTTLAYIAARRYAEKIGVKIYNATRGGKLDVFERIDFEKLLNKLRYL